MRNLPARVVDLSLSQSVISPTDPFRQIVLPTSLNRSPHTETARTEPISTKQLFGPAGARAATSKPFRTCSAPTQRVTCDVVERGGKPNKGVANKLGRGVYLTQAKRQALSLFSWF